PGPLDRGPPAGRAALRPADRGARPGAVAGAADGAAAAAARVQPVRGAGARRPARRAGQALAGRAHRLRDLLPHPPAPPGVPGVPGPRRGRLPRERGGQPGRARAAAVPRVDRGATAARGPELLRLPPQAHADGGVTCVSVTALAPWESGRG